MSLRELYQEMILDHGKCPRNFGHLANANCIKAGNNPLCGDQVVVYLQKNENDIVENIQFQGAGCAISIASASLMTEILKGKTIEQVKKIFHQFHSLVTGSEPEENELGKLTIFSGVTEFPARVKCATLAWHTMVEALALSNEG